MAHLTAPDIAAMAPEARALLINSLPGYKSAMLVGTCDAMGQTNLAIVSSHFHLGSNPPLLAMILRPSTGNSERHTLHNLLETQCWTLNGFSLDDAAQAHQTSAPYPKTNRNLMPVTSRRSGWMNSTRLLLKGHRCKLDAGCGNTIRWKSTGRI